jgi:hypothetical protein
MGGDESLGTLDLHMDDPYPTNSTGSSAGWRDMQVESTAFAAIPKPGNALLMKLGLAKLNPVRIMAESRSRSPR